MLLEHFAGDEWKFAPEVVAVLERYSWPGNVRQLHNAIARAKILAEDEVIQLHNLPPEIVRSAETAAAPPPGTKCDLDTLNKLHIQETYARHNGNKARTARALGIGRRTLYRLIEKYHIEPPVKETSE